MNDPERTHHNHENIIIYWNMINVKRFQFKNPIAIRNRHLFEKESGY